ncbi:RNA-directed DNA polymerase-like protein [Gossypium australe]|uniref:RNA-directed DNA polymerase-like protein n=1 Tax=Gossypium australe TaxID=47621 RepID=A0A5B6VMW3_9ROSI|nr:RNA-directed DNA polymerase-like protein [Gossypium australe]
MVSSVLFTRITKVSKLNLRQQRWIGLLRDYDCVIEYHARKANVVARFLAVLKQWFRGHQIR